MIINVIRKLPFTSNKFLFDQIAQKERAPPTEMHINFIKFTGSYEENGEINKVTVNSVEGTMYFIFQDFIMINYFNISYYL